MKNQFGFGNKLYNIMSDSPVNSKFAVVQRHAPWLLSPFTAHPNNIDARRTLTKPIKLSGKDTEDSKYFFLYADNIFLGSCWGLISGYTSDAFFRPSPMFIRPALKSNIFLTLLLASRVSRRMTLSGLLFQAVERKTAEYLDLGKRSSIASNLGGLTALAVAFRVSRQLSKSAFLTIYLLGGYLIGSSIAREIHEYSMKSRRERHRKDD